MENFWPPPLSLKMLTKCLWRWEPDRRYNFFFSPPEHLCAVTYITGISLHVTLNTNTLTHSHANVQTVCHKFHCFTKCLEIYNVVMLLMFKHYLIIVLFRKVFRDIQCSNVANVQTFSHIFYLFRKVFRDIQCSTVANLISFIALQSAWGYTM